MENSDKISFHATDEIDEKVQMLMRQTDYSDTTAREKLTQHNFDMVSCIKEYMGVESKKKEKPISLNQRIYKEIRTKMGSVELPDPKDAQLE